MAPGFEVASIRQNEKPTFRRPTLSVLPGGRFQASNVSVRDLIIYAYGLTGENAVENAPGWTINDRFEINAKAPQDWPAGEIDNQTARRMLQDLLNKRFKLSFRQGDAAQSSFALVLARDDGRLGPQLRKSNLDCAQIEDARLSRIAAGGNPTAPENRRGQCTVSSVNGVVRFTGHTTENLALYLSNSMRANVIDRTGLKGPYAIELNAAPYYVPELARTELLAKENAAPSLDVALREQLGLRLDKIAVAKSTLIIDRIERPTAD